MALQKEAFQLVIGFMMEGLDTNLGGMVDILATMATSRDERRRLVLHGIGVKYQTVAADWLLRTVPNVMYAPHEGLRRGCWATP